jgi:hypothetical protein
MCWLHGEPTLEDVLADPIITALMERDHVSPDDLVLLLEDVRKALQREASAPGRYYRALSVPVQDHVTA